MKARNNKSNRRDGSDSNVSYINRGKNFLSVVVFVILPCMRIHLLFSGEVIYFQTYQVDGCQGKAKKKKIEIGRRILVTETSIGELVICKISYDKIDQITYAQRNAYAKRGDDMCYFGPERKKKAPMQRR